MKILKVLILSIVIFSIIACSSKTPKCSKSETKNLVIDIVKQQLSRVGFGNDLNKLEMKVENIRTI